MIWYNFLMKRWIFSLFFIALFFPVYTHAVLPPDVIFSIGSQLSQMFAVVGIFVAGGIMSVVLFGKKVVEKIRTIGMKKFISTLILICIIIGSFVYIVTKIKNKQPQEEGGPLSQSSYQFHSDRFVLAGELDNGKPFLFDIDINRKEIGGAQYIHYYMGNLVEGESSQYFYEKREANKSTILSDLFFKDFNKSLEEDHSSRYSYDFSFSFSGKNYTVSTDTMESDFIIKNEPEYTSYVSAGEATLSVEGVPYTVHIMHQAIYSTDYRKSVFFEGFSDLKSQTHQLILWDDEGTFYLVDQSEVDGYSQFYASHFWTLTKYRNESMKKAFSGTVTKTNTNFTASIPRFENTKINVYIKNFFERNSNEGYVEGSITDALGTRSISGLGYYHRYGEQNE
jgi:hypothetical protein